jgi:hypothetical protein
LPAQRKQVAEQFGVGEEQNEIPEEKMKEVVRLVLIEDEGKQMRRRVENLKEMASKAVREGGSSKTNLQAFMREMQKLTILGTYNRKTEIGNT